MARRKGKLPQSRHDPDFRVKVVKTSIEKKLNGREACELFGVGMSTWWTWKRVYTEKGEAALRAYGESRRRAKKQLPPAAQEKLREQVLEVKGKYPFFGVLPKPAGSAEAPKRMRFRPDGRKERGPHPAVS